MKEKLQWRLEITLPLRNNLLFIILKGDKIWYATAPYILVKIQKLFHEYFPICYENLWLTYLLHGTTVIRHYFAWTHMFTMVALVISELCHHWFRYWFVARSMPIYYLCQHRYVNLTLKTTFDGIVLIFIKWKKYLMKMYFKMSSQKGDHFVKHQRVKCSEVLRWVDNRLDGDIRAP